MYHSIIKKIVRKSFGLVNQRRFIELLKGVATNIRHSFAGDHSLGGTRNDVSAFKAWLERLARVMPEMSIALETINVIGWPNNTLAIARWTATATLLNGEPYLNKGVHFITIKWGKVTNIDVYEDTHVVFNGLETQYASGIKEAKAPQIIS